MTQQTKFNNRMAAWNIKDDDKRSADQTPVFVIFCEDEACEIDYIKGFETNKIKINPIGGQKSSFRNVVKAIKHCRDHNLFTVDEQGSDKLPIGDSQVWCVYDRDRNPDLENGEEDIAFDESINLALSKNIQVAWSNDAFELWLLLHLREIDPVRPENASREAYYQQLTEVFRNIETTDERLIQKRASAMFTYKASLKPRRSFLSIVLPTIRNLTTVAIARSVALEAYHQHQPEKSPNQKTPCTMMHHLVRELQRLG